MDDIKDIVYRVVENLSEGKGDRQNQFQEVWKKVTSDKEKKHTQIVGAREDKILVNVDSSAWLYQMNIKKGKYLKQIQKEIPGVKGISFKIGKIS